jgi:TRAP-type C4-dicarboxylate transport system substrate-binding protein
MDKLNRRRVLKAGAVSMAFGLAGCSGDGGDGGDGGSDGGDGGSDGSDGGSDGGDGGSDGGDGGTTEQTPTDTYDWDMATISAEGGSYAIHGQEFAKHINDISGGRFNVNVAVGGQYGTEPEQLQSVASGAVEMAAQSACLPEAMFIDPTYIICATFFHLDNPKWESYMQFRKRSFNELDIAQGLHDAGVHVIGPDDEPQKSHVYGTARGMAANKAIRSPADAEGYTTGVANASVMVAPLEGLGFNVVTGAPGEMTSAMQRGTYNARETSPDQVIGNGLYDVASHYMDWRHGMNASYLQINTDLYEGLADYDKDLLLEAQLMARESAGEINRGNQEGYLEEMRNNGMTVVQDFDRDAIWDAAQDGLRQWFNDNDPPITYDQAIEWANLS